MPRLVSAAVTHAGEMGPDLIWLIEKLTAQVGKNFKRGPETRGLTKKRWTAAFRTKLKDAIMAANMRGWGQALMDAGNPIAGWVVTPDDAELPGWDVIY